MSADATVRAAHDEIAGHLAEIALIFTPGTRLTLLARQPSHPDGSRDLVSTDDNLAEAITALRIRLTDRERAAVEGS